MKNFNTYEDVVEHFLKTLPCVDYPYGMGIAMYGHGGYGGAIELTKEGVVYVWSGVGFEDYQFKTKAKNPQHAYMIIKLLTSGVEWYTESEGVNDGKFHN